MQYYSTLKSLSSLLGDFFRDFWPGFLALDQNGDGTDGRDGRDGRTGGRTGRTDGRTDGTDGRDGRTDGIQFHSSTGAEKYSVEFYWDRTIQVYNTKKQREKPCLKNSVYQHFL